ncbi:MAG: epoxyqueuosine reductase QueH, partial [Oscillospiraceae bacterium]
ERGERCYICYKLRLEKTASLAENFDYFTTTLSISPHKNAQWINEIGISLGEKYLPADFKKSNGYKRSIELSKEYGLYRQDYCGCVFSKAKTN